MTFEEFDKMIQDAAKEYSTYLDRTAALEIESAALRFVDDNFRNRSWEGMPWESSGEGKTILVTTGALKRGFRTERSAGQIRVWNDRPYAKVHNEGFNEVVKVKAHKRGVYSGEKKSKRKIVSKYEVKAHSRKMSIKKRQFAPYQGSESPTFNATVETIITKHTNKLLNNE